MAAFFLYLDRFKGLVDFSDRRPFRGVDGIYKLFLVSVPAALSALLFQKFIKNHLFSPGTVAWGLIVGGLVMILIERRDNSQGGEGLESISANQSLGIGLFQILALWPGVSRSGATIIGGMLCGLNRKTAAEFSFLAAVPLLSAAAIFDLAAHLSLFGIEDLIPLLVGLIVSFVTGALAIRFLIAMLGKWNLVPFGIYRILLGIIVLLF